MAAKKSFLRVRTPLLLFMALYFLISFLTYRDYGITWDEPDCYFWGDAYLQYVSGHGAAYADAAVKSSRIHIYCNAYAAILALFNSSLNAETFHWYNLCFAFLAFVAAFELLLHAYGRPWLALLGPALLLLTPRFSGDLANNPRDMSFAVMFFLSLAAVYAMTLRFRKAPSSPGWVLLLGILFGLTHSFRVVGYSIYPIYVLFLGWTHFSRQTLAKPKAWRSFLAGNGLSLISVFLLSNLLMVALFPHLHSDTLPRLWGMLKYSARLFANQTNLFMGREIPAEQLPLIYLPVWLLVTTPLAVLFLAASVPFLKRLTNETPLTVLLGLAFWVHLGLYLLLRPALIDSLRLYLFLLPVIGTLAAAGGIRFIARGRIPILRKAVLALAILQMVFVALNLARLHPYENLYFNEFTGGLKGASGRFETDYWGETFKEAVEWLRSNELRDLDPSKRVVGVNTCGNAMSSMYYFGPGMVWVPFERADYFICFTRWRGNEKAGDRKPLHVVERLGAPLNYVYRLR